MNYEILNSKQKKEMLKTIFEQWGFDQPLDYVFLKKKDGKVFLINREVERVLNERIFIDAMGLYFADSNEIPFRLSFDGAMIVGPHATKNIVNISNAQAARWLRGDDVAIDPELNKTLDFTKLNGFVILQCGKDYLGNGKIRDGNVHNFVPKTRRILSDL